MQALTGVLVMPGLEACAGFQRRNDMRQPRLITALLEHLGDDFFLPDVRLIDMLNRHAVLCRKRLCTFARPIAQWRGKLRVIKVPARSKM